jgi:uncharacterized protein YkwD
VSINVIFDEVICMVTTLMARLVALAVAAGAVCGVTLHVLGMQAPQATRVFEADSVLTEFLEALNRERNRAGIASLKIAPKLTEAARVHVHDMAKHEMLSHQGSDGTTPARRVKQQGYLYQKSGENIASGQATPKAVMQSWMRSPGHRRNILGDFTEVGAALASSKSGTPYWCAVFASPSLLR